MFGKYRLLNRMKSWQSKRLSYGGKATLVKHIIQSMPLYISFQLFPLLQPPQKNSMIMVDFFWGWTNDKISIIGHLGIIYVFLMMTRVLELESYVMCVNLFKTNNGGILGPCKLFEVTS